MNPSPQSSKFSQYRSKRDYRALIFESDGLDSIEQVAALFGGEPLSKSEQKKLPPLAAPNVTGIRVRYFSDQCFLRTSDSQKKNTLLSSGRNGLYEYEVPILSYQKNARPIFLVAVPFSGMSRELFGKIHNQKPSANFKYLRPSLENLIEALQEDRKGLNRIKTIGINWSVAGDTGRSDQLTIRGADVINSNAFRHVLSPEAHLSFSLRKVQIIHEGFGGTEKLRLTFDKFGNYGVWVTQEACNLPDVFSVFELFKKSKLIEEDAAFPVRNREDEPLLP